MSRWLRALAGVALSLLLLAWVLRDVSFAEVARQIRGADPLLLGLAVLVSLTGFLFRAQRWRILLRPVSRTVPFHAAFGATMVGFAANNLLPARVGELARAYALGRSGAVSGSAALGALVLERLLDGVILLALLFAVMAAPGFPLGGAVDARGAGILVAVVFVAALAALRLLIARPAWLVRAAGRVAARLTPRLRERLASSLGAFLDGGAALRDARLFALSAAWAAGQWLSLALSYLLAFHAFGIRSPGAAGAVFLQSLVTLAVAIPSSPGFFGPFEAAARVGLELWNVPAEQAVSFAIGFHLAGFVPVTVIGLLYAWRMGLGVREVRGVGMPTPDEERSGAGDERSAGATARAALVAPAKVNLRLRVLERRESGYHELETLFLAIALADEVEVELRGQGMELEVVGGDAAVGPAEENLVARAARAYQRESGWEAGLHLRLTKRVPAAAGLGGGSSDAAATLRLLEALSPRPLGMARLRALALELGSDVPFFLCGSPYALARGRGELLEALPPLPARPLLVAHPGVELPTGAAFAELAALRTGAPPPSPVRLDPRATGSWEGAMELAVNDFEEVALRRVPEIADALHRLSQAGARVARLSGSGAAVFGVFAAGAEGRAARGAAAASLRALGWRVWETESLEEMPLPRVDPTRRNP